DVLPLIWCACVTLPGQDAWWLRSHRPVLFLSVDIVGVGRRTTPAVVPVRGPRIGASRRPRTDSAARPGPIATAPSIAKRVWSRPARGRQDPRHHACVVTTS